MSLARRSALFWGLLVSVEATLALAPASVSAQEACFERLDNGVDMSGWHKSTTNMHGPGDGWTVEDGALVGRQTSGEQGGILMTDQSYADVEVILDVKVNWGCDSGLFFRTTDGNRAYQVTIDHVDDSAVGTIWGEAFPQELREIPYWLTDNGNSAILAPDRHEEPIFDLDQWSTLWDPTAFNEIRSRIEGNPPHIQVWISGTKVMDFTDAMLRSDVDESGPLAIQVHGGSRWIPDGSVAFRNIRVRDLSVPCEDQGGGGAGGAGEGPEEESDGLGGGGAQGSGGTVSVPDGATPDEGNAMPMTEDDNDMPAGGRAATPAEPSAGGSGDQDPTPGMLPAAGGPAAAAGGTATPTGSIAPSGMGTAPPSSQSDAAGQGGATTGGLATATSKDDGGGGCRMPHRRAPLATCWWILLSISTALARRRRHGTAA